MSESDEYKVTECWRLWHLTPRGWIAGDCCDGSGEENKIDQPSDCIQSVRYTEVGAHMLGSKKTTLIVFEKTRKKKAISELIGKFGAAPQKIFE